MDPITSGLTILQVVETIAQASALLCGYVASVRDADSSCLRLIDELGSIRGVLTTVKGIKDLDDPSLPAALRNALSRLMADDGPATKLHEELKNLLPNDQQSSKMGMMTKMTWPFKEKKVAAIIDKLKKYYCDISTILAIDSWTTLKEVHREVQEVDRRLQEDYATRKVHERAEERRKLLQWMAPVSCKPQHDQSVKYRSAETGQWIFETNHYKTWNTSDCAFLWLNGQPGAGKTILASAVIDKIPGDGEAEPQTLAYFYCNFRDEKTTIASAVLRTLACNLLRESTNDWITKIGEREQQQSDAEEHFISLRKLRQQYRSGEKCPTDLDFLRKLIVEASKLVHRPVLVIDALDECKDYCDLVEHLTNLADDARLRLFVTGRIEPDIRDVFRHLPTVSLKDTAEQMKKDIRVHITKQLKTQKRLSSLDEELKTTILETLSAKAEGMFRWVQCQLDEILACKRSASIRKALNNLPKGLYETYDRIIRSIEERGDDDGPITQRCLLLLAGTFTPLTLDELNEAMMTEVEESRLNRDLRVHVPMDIVVACGSLVAYDEATHIVSLSHYSVKEYLIGHCPNYVLKSISDMHARIFLLLATYLLCDCDDEMCGESDDSHRLLDYAAYGSTHLGHVSDEDPCLMAALSRLHSQLCKHHDHEDTCQRHELLDDLGVVDNRWLFASSPSVLFIPLELGKPWMVEFLVKQQPDLLGKEIACLMGSPLFLAISRNPDLLSVLVELGVDLNKPWYINPEAFWQSNIPRGFYTPISWAVAISHDVTVDLLLSHPEVKLPDDILHTAVGAKIMSPNNLRIFCQYGADVNFIVDGSTPIHTLVSKILWSSDKWLQAVKVLVGLSCDLSVQDWTARTALHIALDKRLEDIITYLLRKNAQLSGTATLQPDMWSWAQDKKWFAKVQAAALAADQPCTRIKGKVIEANRKSQLVEFPGAVTADHEDPNPICAVVVSAILKNPTESRRTSLRANLSRPSNSGLSNFLHSKEDPAQLQFKFSWGSWQCVSSRLFDYHQGDKITSTLRQLTEDVDSTSTSLFLQIFGEKSWNPLPTAVEYILDIYRGPLH